MMGPIIGAPSTRTRRILPPYELPSIYQVRRFVGVVRFDDRNDNADLKRT